MFALLTRLPKVGKTRLHTAPAFSPFQPKPVVASVRSLACASSSTVLVLTVMCHIVTSALLVLCIAFIVYYIDQHVICSPAQRLVQVRVARPVCLCVCLSHYHPCMQVFAYTHGQ